MERTSIKTLILLALLQFFNFGTLGAQADEKWQFCKDGPFMLNNELGLCWSKAQLSAKLGHSNFGEEKAADGTTFSTLKIKKIRLFNANVAATFHFEDEHLFAVDITGKNLVPVYKTLHIEGAGQNEINSCEMGIACVILGKHRFVLISADREHAKAQFAELGLKGTGQRGCPDFGVCESTSPKIFEQNQPTGCESVYCEPFWTK